MWSRFQSWIRAVVRRPRIEREMDAELCFHIEAYAEDLVRGRSLIRLLQNSISQAPTRSAITWRSRIRLPLSPWRKHCRDDGAW